MQFVKVNGTNMVRDINSMALLPSDNTEKNEYLAKLRVVKNQKDEINTIRSEIDSIKSDVNDIKNLMLQLLGKK
jgi:hypothetical protein